MSPLNSWEVIEPDNYYKSFISQSIRPDGRDWNTARSISVRVGSVGTAEGSATVRLGNTTMVCGLKAELCSPTLQEPNKGFIVPNVELYSCCSPNFKAGPPGEKAIATSMFLHNILHNNDIVDFEKLCIVPNKWAWCIYCDVVCLDYDGNLVDASVLAMMTALLHLKLPSVTYDPDTEQISLSEQHLEKLEIKKRPISTTFGIYSPEVQLLDPTAADERECGGEVSVVMFQSGELCSTRKTGGRHISTNSMETFITAAQDRLPALHSILEEALQKELMDTSN